MPVVFVSTADGLQILVSHTLLADNADGLWDVAGNQQQFGAGGGGFYAVILIPLAERSCVLSKPPSTTTVSSAVEAAKAVVGVNAIAMQAASNEGVAAG